MSTTSPRPEIFPPVRITHTCPLPCPASVFRRLFFHLVVLLGVAGILLGSFCSFSPCLIFRFVFFVNQNPATAHRRSRHSFHAGTITFLPPFSRLHRSFPLLCHSDPGCHPSCVGFAVGFWKTFFGQRAFHPHLNPLFLRVQNPGR